MAEPSDIVVQSEPATPGNQHGGRSPQSEPPEPPASRDLTRRALFALAIVAAGSLLWFIAPGIVPANDTNLGWWSLLPALVTLVVVFVTHEVIVSLVVGIAVGGIVSGQLNILGAFVIPAVGSESYALILVVYLWALGGMIGIWTRTGGAEAFAAWAASHIVRGPKSARVFAWLVSMVFHQGGTISTILTGTTVRPVTDAQRVSHEELTYIVDSTASPGATVIPFNAWPLYVAGLIVGTTPLFVTEQQAVAFFFSALPYNFYAIFAVASTLLFALGWLPWKGAKMRRAIERARTTGQLNAPDAQPVTAVELTQLQVPAGYRTGLADFFVPILTLISVAVVPYFLTGTVRIAEAFGLAVLSAFTLAVLKGMSLRDAMDGFVDGCKGVTVGAVILGLAVTLGFVSGELNTAEFLVEAVSDVLPAVMLPALFMAICMGVAFSIGSSWGTYAVVFPLAMPLAWAINPDPQFLTLCFSAVLGGAVFGDQCSPISDTTILSALACGGDVMDHVTTQLPLALAAAGLAATTFTVLAALG